ncbi:sensor histidine kinase [Gordonibacter sp. An230]|uniref:sensor histidine kinase n=1 Tax=Gordonibacter sp. An230 TaxID=1965592 RepID=UPI001EF40BF3|nr:histidine kinase [Gordonibacter sp. An230]
MSRLRTPPLMIAPHAAPSARPEGYTGIMNRERAIDQIVLAALCLASLPFAPPSDAHVVAFLAAVAATCCLDVASSASVRIAAAGAYLAAACALFSFASFLPLVAYALGFERSRLARSAWIVPLAASARSLGMPLAALLLALCVAACLMAWRERRAEGERARSRALRDSLQERSLSLARKNRDLMASHDYEVRLATLAERARIAREIHDNVGHLLTRSVLQVEALQVVHAEDERARADLAQVGATLHEAMDTVRKSVHDLHDDAFDLRSRLESVVEACGLPGARLSFDARDVPVPVAYCFVALAREALSNVVRHSDATRVDVSVIEYPAFYQLVVQDNGSAGAASAAVGKGSGEERSTGPSSTGTTAAAPLTGEGGLGLKSMEERVAALGGRLRAEHRAGKGFRVFAIVPKEEKRND